MHPRRLHDGRRQSDAMSIDGARQITFGEVRLVAYMLAGVTGLLLQKVDEIRRTKLAQGDERLGTGIDGFL